VGFGLPLADDLNEKNEIIQQLVSDLWLLTLPDYKPETGPREGDH
jgi:hypothetical protein